LVVAGSGKDALEAWRKHSFDLVLMDVQMPEMDGFEATAAIREQEKSGAKHILIIAMTAHAMVGDRERCLAAGMDDYVSKPIKAANLFAAIDRRLSWIRCCQLQIPRARFLSARRRRAGRRRYEELSGHQFHGALQLAAGGVNIPSPGTADECRHAGSS
jgi:CheY-like chemotaxis protein